MCKHVLSGPLDGLLKAVYSDRDAELVIRYAGDRMVLDEDECDKLLRVIECAPSNSQAVNDLAEFFETEFGIGIAGRIALWFHGNAYQIAKRVYADVS